MTDWERRYRELYAAVWLIPEDEIDCSIEDVAGHVETIAEIDRMNNRD